MVAAGSIIRDNGNKNLKKRETNGLCNVYYYNIFVCSVNQKYVNQRCVEEPNVTVCIIMYFIKIQSLLFYSEREREMRNCNIFTNVFSFDLFIVIYIFFKYKTLYIQNLKLRKFRGNREYNILSCFYQILKT